MKDAVLFAFLALAVVAGACSQDRLVRFPHRVHLVDLRCGAPGQPACLSCSVCHTPSGEDRIHKLPDASLCARCHESNLHAVERVLRIQPDRPVGDIRFDHDEHLAMTAIEGQCVPCHAGVVEEGRPSIPPMAKCFSCHEHDAQWKAGECRPCHATTDLTHVLPQTFLRHDASFMRKHSTLAMEQGKVCQSCHTESECNDCHDINQVIGIEQRRPEQVKRQFVHRGDFLVRHPIEAQSEPARCQRCHEPETCDACHVQRGVSGNAMNGRNPHPQGWVGNFAGSSSFHGRAARRDIVLCASCHEQGPATNCIRCHKVGAYGGNPHPNGWRSARSTDDTMCRYCHE